MTEFDEIFQRIPEQFRGKVAKDMLSHVDEATGSWKKEGFNPLNDYQRHLYGLFLRLSGKSEAEVFAEIFSISTDVPLNKRQRYVEDVINSEIVGFPQADGSLIEIPKNQEIAEV